VMAQRFQRFSILALALVFARAAVANPPREPAAPPGYAWRYDTRAVDAKRKAHFSIDFSPRHSPWADDLIHRVQPQYPYADRSAHRSGKGLYRLSLDLHTGAVTRVRIVRSAGSATFDASAIEALRQWTFKPEIWLEVDMPVEFWTPPRSL
jgi:TonB family protein